MTENRSRYVLLCQQTLALAVVTTTAFAAAGVVPLELVQPAEKAPAARAGGQSTVSLVSSEPVVPTVRTVRLTGASAQARKALPQSRTGGGDAGRFGVLSDPLPATGYATVGVTWKQGADLDHDTIAVSVRTLRNGTWSSWQEMHYDDAHLPDPGSPDAAATHRPGTDAVVVGDVDQVQVRAVTRGVPMPRDLALSIIDPGQDIAPTLEAPAIDTGEAASLAVSLVSAETDPAEGEVPPADATEVADPAAELVGTPGDVTPKPQIFSRAQWGADERLRDKASLRYGEVHAGFVHHTVNANDYSKAQVPAILRGIYAYHTQSRGWSDVGYNFLVDRFGQIWEGRAGGVDRPVVGAHTLGYNDYAFAMSAVGNFDTARPGDAMVDAYGRLMAWKLALHGVSASDTSQRVGDRTLPAINGHRDAGQTACPGRYLYARMADIRSLATSYQKGSDSRDPRAQLSGLGFPDILVRDAATQRAVVVRTAGQVGWSAAVPAGSDWSSKDLIAAAGDVTGDGWGDVLARDARSGSTTLYAGGATNNLRGSLRTYDRFTNLDLLVGAGDLDGDGRRDLVGRHGTNKALIIYPGTGNGGFGAARVLRGNWGGYDLIAAAGDLDGDGRDDLAARAGSSLYVLSGTANGLAPRRALPGDWSAYDVITGGADLNGDRRPDLLARNRSTRYTSVFPGDGKGGLGVPFGPYARFSKVRAFVVAGQLGGPRTADVLALTSGNTTVRVFAHNGRRNLGRAVDTGVSLADANLLVNTGDMNGDGIGDFLSRERGTGVLRFHRGLGRDRFADPVKIGSGWDKVAYLAAVGDMTGDGYPDLMGRYDGRDYRIWPGNGAGGLRASFVAHSFIAGNAMTALGRSDADGAPDVLFRGTDGTLTRWLGNGPGGLVSGARIGSGGERYSWLKGLGDLDGDGRSDLVAREKATGYLWLLPGRASGLGPRRLIGTGFDAYDLLG